MTIRSLMYIDILSVQKQIFIRKCVCGIQKKREIPKKVIHLEWRKKSKKGDLQKVKKKIEWKREQLTDRSNIYRSFTKYSHPDSRYTQHIRTHFKIRHSRFSASHKYNTLECETRQWKPFCTFISFIYLFWYSFFGIFFLFVLPLIERTTPYAKRNSHLLSAARTAKKKPTTNIYIETQKIHRHWHTHLNI